MIWMFLLMYLLIAMEVAWDSYHELKLNEGPDYKKSNLIRLAIGTIYWISFPVLHREISVAQFFTIPFIMMSNFIFFFDWGLNMVRIYIGKQTWKTYYYLGQKARTDTWQIAHGGAKLWFWIKALVALISFVVFIIV